MTRGLGDLAASAARTSAALADAQRAGVRRSALHVTGKIRDQVRRDTGDMRLSGVGKRGAKVGARFALVGDTSNPTAYITATGPMQLLERDTKAHRIPRSRGRRARKRYAVIGGRPYSRAAHPGARGKGTFGKGVAEGAKGSGEIFHAEVARAVRGAWL